MSPRRLLLIGFCCCAGYESSFSDPQYEAASVGSRTRALAILGVGIASFLLWKLQPLGIDNLYGLLD